MRMFFCFLGREEKDAYFFKILEKVLDKSGGG